MAELNRNINNNNIILILERYMHEYETLISTIKFPSNINSTQRKIRYYIHIFPKQIKEYLDSRDSYDNHEYEHIKNLDDKAMVLINTIHNLTLSSNDNLSLEYSSKLKGIQKIVSEIRETIRGRILNLTPEIVQTLSNKIRIQSESIKKIEESNKLNTQQIDSTNENIDKIEIKNLDRLKHETHRLTIHLKELETTTQENSEKQIRTLQTEFSKEIVNKDKEFSSRYTSSLNELDEKSKELFSLIETDNKELSKKIETLEETLHESIKKEVRSFANQKNKLTEVLGSLSEFRRSKSDIDQAEKEGKTANRFRWIGLSLMFLPLISFIAFFVGYKPDAEGVQSLIFTFPDETTGYFLRFLTIVLFSSPSVYLLKESAYHRKQERHYRERGLQLASIGPFLDDFTPEQRVQAKNNLLKTFYCTNDGKADTSNVPDMLKQIQEVAKLSKSLSKIVPTQRQDKPQPTPPKNTPEEEQKETK